ncbi:hypothetical protein LCGC14_1807200 [marine sediment metagenome]|uniref:Uncharacterized protein n=1 Tax=marine sediment metagenome TaxID=412755 RepID=A0A0F9HAS6_9ZZZZ
MTKRYTYVTTVSIEAPTEMKALETMSKVQSQLESDTQVAEHWTKLIDIEDVPDEEED